MARVEVHTDENGGKRLWFKCPGCGSDHVLGVKKGKHEDLVWNWNGSIDKPSLSPSLLVNMRGEKPIRCHSFIKDGKIKFLSDCTHKLAGQTVDLPEVGD